jgi:hypothetical protein
MSNLTDMGIELRQEFAAKDSELASLWEVLAECKEALDSVAAWDASVQHSDPNIPRGLNVGPRAHVHLTLRSIAALSPKGEA